MQPTLIRSPGRVEGPHGHPTGAGGNADTSLAHGGAHGMRAVAVVVHGVCGVVAGGVEPTAGVVVQPMRVVTEIVALQSGVLPVDASIQVGHDHAAPIHEQRAPDQVGSYLGDIPFDTVTGREVGPAGGGHGLQVELLVGPHQPHVRQRGQRQHARLVSLSGDTAKGPQGLDVGGVAAGGFLRQCRQRFRLRAAGLCLQGFDRHLAPLFAVLRAHHAGQVRLRRHFHHRSGELLRVLGQCLEQPGMDFQPQSQVDGGLAGRCRVGRILRILRQQGCRGQ